MDNEKNLYGIDVSQPFASLVSGFVTTVINIDKDGDGNIEGNEILGAAKDVAMDVLFNKPDLKGIKLEGMDYTEEEKAILAEQFAAKNGIPQAKARVLTNRGFAIALDLVDFAIDAQKPADWFENQ